MLPRSLGEVPGFLILIAVFIFSLMIHESAHALVAYRLGDPTGKSLGRISLNPLRHLDPMGSLLFLFAGFGWARPVPVDPRNLRGDPRTGMALVSAAGPLSNLALSLIGAVLLPLAVNAPVPRDSRELIVTFVGSLIGINVMLAIFNLIPLAPLDGFKVLLGILPRPMAFNFSRFEAWGPGILFALLALSWFTPFNAFSMVLRPIVDSVTRLLIGIHLF